MTAPDSSIDPFAEDWDEHLTVAAATRIVASEPLRRLIDCVASALANGGKVALFGNGGSAADAQHIATELVVRYRRNRAPISAIALTTDSSVLTAIGNDLGFSWLFSRQVEALCRPGDVCIGLTTSGRSENVLLGLRAARAMGCVAAAFGGGDGGGLVDLADPLVLVPTHSTARIQEMHITLGHILCDGLERALGGEQ